MNLHERFVQQQDIKPTDLQKMRIYQRFLDKSHRSLWLSKISHYMKIGVFSFIVFVVAGASYFALQGDGWYHIVRDNTWYQIVTPRAWEAQAQVLGKIIKSKWDISIINTKNNTTITTDTLHEDEHIMLATGAEIEFTVRDDVLAKISWPAEVGLQYLGTQKWVNNYAINLISGDYFEVISIDKDLVGKQLGRWQSVEKNHKESVDHIIVKSPEFSIETKKVQGRINVVIERWKNGKREVENKGSEIVMKTIVENEQKFIAIAPHQKVSVNGEVNFVDVDVEQIKKQIKDKKLTVRYEIKQDKKTSIWTAMVEASTIADVLEEIPVPQKKNMDPTMLQQLDKTLRTKNLEYHLSQIQTYYQNKNHDAFVIAYNNLVQKLREAYDIIWIPAPTFTVDEKHLLDGSQMANTLAEHIRRNYDIDTSHIVGLYMIANTLTNLVADNSEHKTKETSTKTTPSPSSPDTTKKAPTPTSSWTKTLEDQLLDLGIQKM